MRPLVVAETGSCSCSWLPVPHYCTFQLTPPLSFLSQCAMMYFVRMMKITMKMKKQISSSRGGHFRATIFVFRMLVSAVPSLPHSYGHIFSDEGYLFLLFQNSQYLINPSTAFVYNIWHSKLQDNVTKFDVFSFWLKGLLLSQGIWMFDQKLCGTHFPQFCSTKFCRPWPPGQPRVALGSPVGWSSILVVALTVSF